VVETADGVSRLARRTLEIPDADTYPLDFNLHATAVAGIVLAADTGVAPPGAGLGGGAADRTQGLTGTSGEGRFGAEGATGPGRFNASAEGYISKSIPIASDALPSDVRFDLSPAGTLRGRVLDSEGQPAPAVSVAAMQTNPARLVGRATTLPD